MQYTLYELFWLYFLYSFLGWCAEVALAAIARKKFINRGFVTGPLCPIYGAGAVAFAIFLPELTTSPVFLFLGSMILASGIEYFTGAVLEKIFHKRWWDYSNHRFHLNGYVCLRYAFVWGIFGTFAMYLGNHLLLTVVSFIPHMVGFVLLIVLGVLLGCDVLGSSLAIAGLHVKQKRIQDINTQVQKASFLLENAITIRIQSRMQKAFSGLNQPAQATTKKAAPTVFAEGCSFYKLISLFFIGAFLGDITETIFCYVTSGVLMSRSSVVYGPFSIVWGLGCMLLTAVLYLSLIHIYYGDEIGMRYVEGLTSVEGGYSRTGSRSPMQWDDGVNAGFSTASAQKLYIQQDSSAEMCIRDRYQGYPGKTDGNQEGHRSYHRSPFVKKT